MANSENSDEGEGVESSSATVSLPAQDWHAPRDLSEFGMDRYHKHAPVSRLSGTRAERGSLEAALNRAKLDADNTAERAAAMSLSRLLAGQGAELDLATCLGRRALMLGEDSGFREELSGWFAALGERALAAATLRPLFEMYNGAALAKVHTRVAVLAGRNGDGPAAVVAFRDAAAADPSDPSAPELLAAVAAWAPDALSDRESSTAYLDGVQRREAKGDKAGAFEDLLRAFEMAPESGVAAERMRSALASRGRAAAADEVFREHATASGKKAPSIHSRRMMDAALEAEYPRALAAGFDARRDGVFGLEELIAAVENDDALSFDGVAIHAGLSNLSAARLELFGVDVPSKRRNELLAALYARSGARREDSGVYWSRVLATRPGSERARTALVTHGHETGNWVPLIEALLRVCLRANHPARNNCLLGLVSIAQECVSDPALAAWALEELRAAGPLPTTLEALPAQLNGLVRLQDSTLQAAKAALPTATGAARLDLLRQLAVALRGRPAKLDDYLEVLKELSVLAPAERVWTSTLALVLERAGRLAELKGFYETHPNRKDIEGDGGAASLAWAEILLSEKKTDEAIAELEPLLGRGAHGAMAAAYLCCLANLSHDDRRRSRAVEALATSAKTELAALLLAVASGCWQSCNEPELARSCAERACQADPTQARPVCALAAVVQGQHDPAEALALERAMALTIPRAALCRALANAHESLGDIALSLAWTQRALAMRPGDPEAAAALLDRVGSFEEPQSLGDVLGWLLSQAMPLTMHAEALAAALFRLSEVDPVRGGGLVRRALDIFGPRVEWIASAVREVAVTLDEPTLALALIERQLASGAPGIDRSALLLAGARLRRLIEDYDGAAQSYYRVLSEGGDAGPIAEQLAQLPQPPGSDGYIALLRARVEVLSQAGSKDPGELITVCRELGAALWDLAQDPDGAITIWQRAAAADTEAGLEVFSRDLVAFAGAERAREQLLNLAARRREPKGVAETLVAAAAVAHQSGDMKAGLQIARAALDADARSTDALSLIELCAGEADTERLQEAYKIVADTSAGWYGERALYYRAARHFERRGEIELAVAHSISAFETLPSEGVAFVLMLRLTELLGDSTSVVEAIQRVAEANEEPVLRSAWLQRAAQITGTGEAGIVQRVDVLTRALAASADLATLRALGEAVDELVRVAPADRRNVRQRLEIVLRATLQQASGPNGARLALGAAEISLNVIASVSLCHFSVQRAVDSDASMDEFEAIMPYVERLAKSEDDSRTLLDLVLERAKAGRQHGRPLMDLVLAIAVALGDREREAQLLVGLAVAEPGDAQLQARAQAAVDAVGDAVLQNRMLEAIPVSGRLARLEELANTARAEQDYGTAIALGRVGLEFEDLKPESRAELVNSLSADLRSAERFGELEVLLSREMDALPEDSRSGSRRELARLLAGRGEAIRALEILRAAFEQDPHDGELITEALGIARQAGDVPWQVNLVARLCDLETEPAARLPLLEKLAHLLEDTGDAGAAVSRWEEIATIDPSSMDAMRALERAAESRGDYPRLAELLGRRAAMAIGVDDSRFARLQLVNILDERLGRVDDARIELENLLEAGEDDLEVLEILARLHERVGDRLSAAPLWVRASQLESEDPAELLGFGARAYLDGGDVASACRSLADVSRFGNPVTLLRLRVESQRRSEDANSYSDALASLASASTVALTERVSLLMESAAISLKVFDLQLAAERAQVAAELDRTSPDAQLLAAVLGYRVRGTGTKDTAQETLASLGAIAEGFSAARRDASAFLRAEALDVVEGSPAGQRELNENYETHGISPLVALGVAERLSVTHPNSQSLPLYDVALSGDLQRLRNPPDVAKAAAEVALLVGEHARALSYLDLYTYEGEAASAVGLLKQSIRAAMSGEASPKARATSSPARVDFGDSAIAATERGDSLPTGGVPVGPVPSETLDVNPGVRNAVVYALDPLPKPTSQVGAPPLKPSSKRPAPGVQPGGTQPVGIVPTRSRLPALRVDAHGSNENALLESLKAGSTESGRKLLRMLEADSSRLVDRVDVARVMADHCPGEVDILTALAAANEADGDASYHQAILHVLAVAEGKAVPPAAPELASQDAQPDALGAILFGDTVLPATEVLQIVWESADHLFRRDISDYGVTGVERLNYTSVTPLGQLCTNSTRLLGVSRTVFFHRRTDQPIALQIALLAPPALIVTGDVERISPELRYSIGASLAATMPRHLLVYSAPVNEIEAIFDGVVAAFGPPQSAVGKAAPALSLAERLWEVIPTGTQRVLQGLCEEPSTLNAGLAVEAARRASRRAGLFVSGDLAISVRAVCLEESIDASKLESSGGLAALCTEHPVIADLVQLATSQEYAATRWQGGAL
ncbi:MAG: hypothetical protein HRU17_07740 [Polyangiaceae bacterium]|nr:hypothetical protein [Polyangiaceae bacterium]